jgi:glucose-1-phosphate cytidylyltransferase
MHARDRPIQAEPDGCGRCAARAPRIPSFRSACAEEQAAMKVVILAGGLGSRLSEETTVRPKPMVEVGTHPIIWHIMKYYSMFGHNEFFLALGYKGDAIKQYFLNYQASNRSFRIRLEDNRLEYLDQLRDDWTINLVDTGQATNTGGRLKRLQPYLGSETFMLTYGDGLSTVDLDALLTFHRAHGRPVTITAIHPPARFGALRFEGDALVSFYEKSQVNEGWINGGFMVFEPEIFQYIEGDDSILEANVLEGLVAADKVCAYKHSGFWQCMDTQRDKRYLEELWANGAPWKIW